MLIYEYSEYFAIDICHLEILLFINPFMPPNAYRDQTLSIKLLCLFKAKRTDNYWQS